MVEQRAPFVCANCEWFEIGFGGVGWCHYLPEISATKKPDWCSKFSLVSYTARKHEYDHEPPPYQLLAGDGEWE